MASKLPYKFFDWKQKLTSWSIRINKTIKHRILSKSRNALIITSQLSSPSSSLHSNKDNNFVGTKSSVRGFDDKLKQNLQKTWELYQLNLANTKIDQDYKDIQQKFKGRQYDAVIVMPESNTNLTGYHPIQSESFVTDTTTYHKNLLKNVLAYRLAHKYLTPSGVIILSTSQSDFAKVQNKNGELRVKQPALKNILDAQTSYMAVVIGDRDYTDLNSWSVVGLSEEFIKSQHQDYVVKMYGDWIDGRNLPMPGSFALFRMKEEGKKHPFVQYL